MTFAGPNFAGTVAASGVLCLAAALGSGLTACKSSPAAASTAGKSSTACQSPGTHPRFIAILIQGIGSQVQNGAPDGQRDRPFNPARVSYCAAPKEDGLMPPSNDNGYIKSMADGWLNWPKTDKATVGSGNNCGASSAGKERKDQNCNLVDALAKAGGYVLPFSYSPSYSYDGPSARFYSGVSSHGPAG